MPNYVDLNRRFIVRTAYDASELVVAEVAGKRLGWVDVLESRIAVVIAPANFGKTMEMLHLAKQMRTNSKLASFVQLRRVLDRGGLERALEGDDLAAYRTWKDDPSRALKLFVDSLDEAAAGTRGNVAQLVRDIADELPSKGNDVQWVISSRPAVLTDKVRAELCAIFVPARGVVVVDNPPVLPRLADAAASEVSTAPRSAESDGMRFFSMLPLDSRQAEQYLSACCPELSASELLAVASERGLGGFTVSPGGLDILARIDIQANLPESLLGLFRRVVEAVKVLRMHDSRLEDEKGLASDAMEQVAQKLASASQLCQLVNIEMPADKLAVPESALSARLIGGATLTERAMNQLLSSQLFIDVGFHQVKIYPDELAPFLAAQRLASLAQSPEHALRLVDQFAWSAPTGEQGVYRQFLPLMGWLATLNPHCREELLKREPQALAFFGDLRSVPPGAAEEALSESIRRVVEHGDRLGRGMFSLTSENYWQAGSPRLLRLVSHLFNKYGQDNWAVSVPRTHISPRR